MKYSTESICLGESNVEHESNKIMCEETNEGLFITEVEYTNDYTNICTKNSNDVRNEQLHVAASEIRYQSNKNVGSSKPFADKCAAYPTVLLADICNGKNACPINLKPPSFNYSFFGSNCNFKAEILQITYECVPSKC